MNDFAIKFGFEERYRTEAARLFMEAFGEKLGKILGRGEQAEAFIASLLQPDYAISAVSGSGELIGIAGFKTKDGAFVGGSLRDLFKGYGYLGGLWRGIALAFLEREVERNSLLMDGICVARDARGSGVGTALLDEISQVASDRGMDDVRLDVIDSNPRAKALYIRRGFVEEETVHLGPLRYLFGFASATTMRLAV